MKGLENLPADVQKEIRSAFNEAVNQRVQAEIADTNTFNKKLKESYDAQLSKARARIQLESKIALAKKERAFKVSLAKIESDALKAGQIAESNLKAMYESRAKKAEDKMNQLHAHAQKCLKEADEKVAHIEDSAIKAGIETEKSLNAMYEAKMQKYAAQLTKQVLKENAVPSLQAEDSEKVLKLLSLFEEMLKVFGVTLQEVMEQTESEKDENKDKELNEAKVLKNSYRKVFKENIVLKSAIRNNVSDLAGFKQVMANIKFVDAKSYNESCDIMAEKFNAPVTFNESVSSNVKAVIGEARKGSVVAPKVNGDEPGYLSLTKII